MEWKIYKITNKLNNKVYIGQTKNKIQARFKAHLTAARLGKTFRFYQAIRKHGEEAFYIEEVCTVNTIEEANILETKYILEFMSNNPKYGYNGTSGGTGGWMIGKLSEEKQLQWKNAVSKASKGNSNGRYCGTTDEEIKKLLIEFATKFGYICGLQPLVGYGVERGIEIPKHFTQFRFGGNYRSLTNDVAKELKMEYIPHIRGEKWKISQHYKQLSKQRKMPKKIKEVKSFEGRIKKIRDSKIYDKNYRFCGTTNEQLIELMENFLHEHSRYPTHLELIEYGKKIKVKVPSGFTKTRFSSMFSNLQKIVAERTGIQHTKKRKQDVSNS